MASWAPPIKTEARVDTIAPLPRSVLAEPSPRLSTLARLPLTERERETARDLLARDWKPVDVATVLQRKRAA